MSAALKSSRERLESTMRTKCARLYDAGTPEKERRRLSMEVAMLRCRLLNTKDPLAAMQRASEQDGEC